MAGAPAAFFGAALLGYSASITIQALAVSGRRTDKVADEVILVLLLLELVLSMSSEGAMVHMAGRAYAREPVRLGEAYGRAALRLPAYAITALMAGVVTLVGFVFLIVPGLVALGAFAFWRQAVVLEGRGGSVALARSAVVARPVLWRLVGALGLIWLFRFSFVELTIMTAQAWGDPAIKAFMSREARTLDAVVLGLVVWRLLVDPVVVAFLTRLYTSLIQPDTRVGAGAEPGTSSASGSLDAPNGGDGP